jgi:Concanavalin A-like lectin/glucanases superfamily
VSSKIIFKTVQKPARSKGVKRNILTSCVFLYFIVLAFVSLSFAQSNTWKINNLKKIGKHKAEVLGNPKVVKKAIEFDGIDDGIFLDTNPIEGFSTFTIEAIFRPDSGGNKEQRWFHIEQNELESRVLLETRLVGDEWFLDTFMKSGENRLPLLAENFKHKLGEWYHVALVFDGKEMSHYVNGKFEMSGKIDFKPMKKGKTSFGVRQNKVYWFKGAIRKIRITNKALTPKEFTYENKEQ